MSPKPTTATYRWSKTIRAPLEYVYSWCTDFQDDDGRFSRLRPRISVLQRERTRVVRTIEPGGKGRRPTVVEIIQLDPPNRWHLDQFGVDDDETVSYRLSRVNRGVTRIDCISREKWKTSRFPSRAVYLEGANAFWDRIVTSLERDFRARRPATRGSRRSRRAGK